MSASSSAVRIHRIIGGAAILHAAIIGGIVIGMALHGRFPSSRLWIGFVTLWLVWPVALLVHHGRSLHRVLIPLLVSALLLWPASRTYMFSAAMAFGFPPGMTLYPRDVYDYFTAHRAGHAQAERDLRAGVLAVESYGLPMPPEYTQILRERYGVQLRSVAGDTDVTAKALGHAEGYNELSKTEIRRRFGDGVLEAATQSP
jgi:hypothetical protein